MSGTTAVFLVILGAIVGALGYQWQKFLDRKERKIETKQRIYEEFISSIKDAEDAAGDDDVKAQQAYRELNHKAVVMVLYAPAEVMKPAFELKNSFNALGKFEEEKVDEWKVRYKKFVGARRDFLLAARNDLFGPEPNWSPRKLIGQWKPEDKNGENS